MRDVPIEIIVSSVIVLFFAIGLHEFAHCKVAEMAGDPTPRLHGRVTLNLFKHFELMGTLMMVASAFIGYGIGWGKPAPMQPKLMKDPRWDFFSAVIAGPLSNLAQAILFAMLMRLGLNQGWASPDAMGQPYYVFVFLYMAVFINLRLCFFNLLPIGPLDGQWILGCFLPEKQQILWYQWNRQYGFMAFVAIILISQVTGSGIYTVLIPVTSKIFELLTGLHL